MVKLLSSIRQLRRYQ